MEDQIAVKFSSKMRGRGYSLPNLSIKEVFNSEGVQIFQAVPNIPFFRDRVDSHELIRGDISELKTKKEVKVEIKQKKDPIKSEKRKEA